LAGRSLFRWIEAWGTRKRPVFGHFMNTPFFISVKGEITSVLLEFHHVAVFLQTTVNGGRELRWDANADADSKKR
jgi:hypothetical protein